MLPSAASLHSLCTHAATHTAKKNKTIMTMMMMHYSTACCAQDPAPSAVATAPLPCGMQHRPLLVPPALHQATPSQSSSSIRRGRSKKPRTAVQKAEDQRTRPHTHLDMHTQTHRPSPTATSPASTVHVTTLYKRPLDPQLTPFSSHEGRTLFREALEDGCMTSYFALAEQYQTQSEPAYCGLGTLAMMLNTLQLDPGRQWRGVWRWYSEELLAESMCCVQKENVKAVGITMDEFLCMAKCNGADIQMLRPAAAEPITDTAATSTAAAKSTKRRNGSSGDGMDGAGLNMFRNLVIQSTANAQYHVVASFSRSHLGQTGSGHFSPLGGYHKDKDLVLLMDVARFKYSSYWVPLRTLYEAMLPIDKSTRKSRGYFLMRNNDADHGQEPWPSILSEAVSATSTTNAAKEEERAVEMEKEEKSENVRNRKNFAPTETESITSVPSPTRQSGNRKSSMLHGIFLSTQIPWRSTIKRLMSHVNGIIQRDQPQTVPDLIRSIFQHGSLPPNIENSLIIYANTLMFESTACTTHRSDIITLFEQMRKLPFFRIVRSTLNELRQGSPPPKADSSCESITWFAQASMSYQLATLLLLSLPMRDTFQFIHPALFEELQSLRKVEKIGNPSSLYEELAGLRYQLQVLCDQCGSACGNDAILDSLQGDESKCKSLMMSKME